MLTEPWYRDAVVYCLDVETFRDGNGDGVGDFPGLTGRLDYIAGLGASCVWLLPIYPTPNLDNGYDVTDYYGVDPRLGSLGDFVEFVKVAEERGLRVLLDLPVNHTSVEHPWFQEARSDPDSRYRDFYVWSEHRPKDADQGMIFPGVQESVWTWDEEAERYYFHRFYEHQPDLNIANPEVRAEIGRIMGFWLELGVSGFRLDAAPFLIELKGIPGTEGTDPYGYLEELRTALSWARGDAIMLAEANVAPEQVDDYLRADTRMHMLFDFLVNQHLWLALARGSRTPLVEGLRMRPEVPPGAQWAQFLRNHDELDLGRLTELQREEVYEAFAPDPDMRLYDRGIRRRLAPMLGGDPERLRMALSLMLTLPGTPVLRYGQEIGMGEDLSLPERTAVRTPMQWSDEPNGGFSTADASELARPALDEGPFGYASVNVEAQETDPESLLAFTERAIRTRRRCHELGRGELVILETDHDGVFAHACTYEGGTVLAVHSLVDERAEVRVDASELEGETLVDLLGGEEPLPLEKSLTLSLGRYGFRWLRVTG